MQCTKPCSAQREALGVEADGRGRQAQQCIDRPDPERAGASGLDSGHQADVRHLRHLVRREAIDPLWGCPPDVAFTIFCNRDDAIGEQAREGGGPFGKQDVAALVELDAPEALPGGADPQVVAAIAQDGTAPAAFEVPEWRRRGVGPAEAVELIGHDDGAERVLADCARLFAQQCHLDEPLPGRVEFEKAAPRTGIEPVPRAQEGGGHRTVGHAAVLAPAAPALSVEPKEPGGGAGPQAAARVLGYRCDCNGRESICGAVRADTAAGEHRHAAWRAEADPHAAVGGGVQRTRRGDGR